jgi:hypothetical protein
MSFFIQGRPCASNFYRRSGIAYSDVGLLCVLFSVHLGLSSQASERIAAIESRQDDIDSKVSQVLASTALQTEALAELNSMLSRYIGKGKHNDEGSPSLSKPFLENRVTSLSAPLPLSGEKDGEGPGEDELKNNVDVTSEAGDLEQKVGTSDVAVERQWPEVGIPPQKKACPLGAGTKKVDSNQRSGSTGPVEGTETPTASTACADHVQDKPTLQQPPAKATPVKPQTCATARATTTKFTNMETRRGAAE